MKDFPDCEKQSPCTKSYSAIDGLLNRLPTFGGIRHMFLTLRFSLEGIFMCARKEIAFKQELAIGVVIAVAVIILPISFLLRIYLVSLWVILICMELVNTAIETVVDLVSPEWNILAKQAKDLGGAAVLCMVLLNIVSWTFTLVNVIAR